MNSHSEIEAQLATYGDLDALARQAVDAHVQTCAACAAQLRGYQEMDQSLNLLMASRVHEAKRRPVDLPRALVAEKQRRSLAWWEVFQFHMKRGLQRWQPVMVGVLGLILFFGVTHTYLPTFTQDVDSEPDITQTPAGQLEAAELIQTARSGIEKSLRAELIARHSGTNIDASFIDPLASSTWRADNKRIIYDPTRNWNTAWIDIRIGAIELLKPDLALVRFVIILPLGEMEMGRVYRQENGWWYWTEPPAEFWGEARVLETDHLRFEYRERDAQQVESMADLLETLYVNLHQTLDTPIDAPVDLHNYFANYKFTFQPVPEEIIYPARSGPIYRFSSPAFMPLTFNEQTLNERYTTLLATQLVSGVVQKMRNEALQMGTDWAFIDIALKQKLLTDHVPYEIPPRERWQERLTALVANVYPLTLTPSVESMQTLPPSAQAGLLVAPDTFVSYVENKYGADKLVVLLRAISNQTDPPEVVVPAVFGISLTQLEADWNGWLLREYPFLQTAIAARQAIESSLAAETKAVANGDTVAYRNLLDPTADAGQVSGWLRWLRSATTIPAYQERQLKLVELTVKDDLARVRVRIEQPESVLSPLVEGRMYRWDGEQWLRTSPTEFDGEATKTIETENFRFTFQESDTAAVLQAAAAIESAYARFLRMLQLPIERPISRYDFLEDGKFNLEVRPEIVTNWRPKARIIPITSPFFQSWPEKSSEGSGLTYSVMGQLETQMWEEVTGGQHWQNWGVLTSGISQWLIEESIPNPPWRGSDYLQEEIEKFLHNFFPVQIEELKSQTDTNTGFVVGRLLLDYIVDKYGEDHIASYIRGLGEYDTWDELTQAIFKVDATTFEKGWNQYLAEQYPEETGN